MSAWFLLDVMWIPKTERYSGYMSMFDWNKWVLLCVSQSVWLCTHTKSVEGKAFERSAGKTSFVHDIMTHCSYTILQGENHNLFFFLFRGVVEGWGAWIFLLFNSHILRWKKSTLLLLSFVFISVSFQKLMLQ